MQELVRVSKSERDVNRSERVKNNSMERRLDRNQVFSHSVIVISFSLIPITVLFSFLFFAFIVVSLVLVGFALALNSRIADISFIYVH